MKQKPLFFLVFLLVLGLSAGAAEDRRKRKARKAEADTTAVTSGHRNEFERLTAGAESRKGMMNLYMAGNTLYMEIPDSLMGRCMLFAARIAETSDNSAGIAGEMPNTPVLMEWVREGDKVFMRQVQNSSICDEDDPIALSLRRNNANPVMKVFPVKASDKDAGTVLIDVTKLFCSDEKPVTPLSGSPGISGKMLKGAFRPELSSIVGFKAFPKNISVRSRLSYTTGGRPFSAIVHSSMVLLPKEPMRPRLSDPRLGYFKTYKTVYSSRTDKSRNISYIHRWRLEPKPEDVERYRRGEMVEPARPIVYYVDDALPGKWRKYIKLGIEDWQKAFEAIGFRNAIIARDFPKDDPDFDPEDIRYSCFRYATTTVANAMGPSWTDPRSGEIIQGAVYMYHDVLKLVHNWKFVQTAQVDPKARQAVFDEETMGASLRYVASHEIGHTLGLMHNMRASYSLPVDSLRSPTFTARYGTTTSIMDYARNNYVAQPEDRDVRLIPPLVGVYDIFMIRLGYAPIYDAATPEDEYETINRWILEKADDPMYTYGDQQFNIPLDPASQSESLGDDAVKASRYGISNLRYIMKHLLEWSTTGNRDYSLTGELYDALIQQYTRYMNHCLAYLGGVYIQKPVAGQDVPRYEAVSRKKQREVLDFFFDEFRTGPEWLLPADVKAVLDMDKTETVENLQAQLVRLFSSSEFLRRISRSCHYAAEPYTMREYLDDIYRRVWQKTLQGRRLDRYERNLQSAYVSGILNELGLGGNVQGRRNSVSFGAEEYIFPCQQRENALLQTRAALGRPGSGSAALAKGLYLAQLEKIRNLLESRKGGASVEDRIHYNYLFHRISKALE